MFIGVYAYKYLRLHTYNSPDEAKLCSRVIYADGPSLFVSYSNLISFSNVFRVLARFSITFPQLSYSLRNDIFHCHRLASL